MTPLSPPSAAATSPAHTFRSICERYCELIQVIWSESRREEIICSKCEDEEGAIVFCIFGPMYWYIGGTGESSSRTPQNAWRVHIRPSTQTGMVCSTSSLLINQPINLDIYGHTTPQSKATKEYLLEQLKLDPSSTVCRFFAKQDTNQYSLFIDQHDRFAFRDFNVTYSPQDGKVRMAESKSCDKSKFDHILEATHFTKSTSPIHLESRICKTCLWFINVNRGHAC